MKRFGFDIDPPTVLRFMAGMLLVSIPTGMAVVDRSSPLLLTMTGCLAFAIITVERRWPCVRLQAWRHFATPLGCVFLALAGWAAASLLWSISPRVSANALLEALLPAFSAYAAILGLAGQHRYFSGRFLSGCVAAGLALGCLAVGFDLAMGMPFQRMFGGRPQPFVLNRAILTILVLSVPALWWLCREWRLRSPVRAFLVVGLSAICLIGESAAAVLGTLIACIVCVSAFHLPRLALFAVVAGVFFAFSLAPIAGEVASHVPKELHGSLIGASTHARLAIWKAFGAVVRERPVSGWGFGASSALGELKSLDGIRPETQAFLAAGHPHNAPLQIWVELGAVGAGLGCSVLALLVTAIVRAGGAVLVPRLALVAAAVGVAAVGHGAWQGWWIAALGVAGIYFVSAAPTAERPQHATGAQ